MNKAILKVWIQTVWSTYSICRWATCHEICNFCLYIQKIRTLLVIGSQRQDFSFPGARPEKWSDNTHSFEYDRFWVIKDNGCCTVDCCIVSPHHCRIPSTSNKNVSSKIEEKNFLIPLIWEICNGFLNSVKTFRHGARNLGNYVFIHELPSI